MKLKVILTIDDKCDGFVATIPALPMFRLQGDPGEETDAILARTAKAVTEFIETSVYVDPDPPGGFVHEIEI